MARPVYQYRPIADNKDTALGILLPLNKGAVGKSASSNYASGSSGGNGVFESSYTTFEAAVSNLKNLILPHLRSTNYFFDPKTISKKSRYKICEIYEEDFTNFNYEK